MASLNRGTAGAPREGSRLRGGSDEARQDFPDLFGSIAVPDKVVSCGARPVIDIQTGDLSKLVDQCEAALIAAKVPIYARGELLVRAVKTKNEPGVIRRDDGSLILTPVTTPQLQDELERVANFRRLGNNEARAADAPAKACRVLLDRIGRWNFPQLRGIAHAPFVRRDGSIASAPGYDKATGLLLAIAPDWPTPIADPKRSDAEAALKRLRHLLSTFAFRIEADESVALAAILTPFARASVDTAPMIGFSAPIRGSGKSLLADLVAIIATGRSGGMMTWGSDPAENRKALTGALLAGDSIVVLDNVEVPLKGELLCSALTQGSLRLRPLGQSGLIHVPCVATLMATGNSLTPAGDMTRRILVAELDPQCERPELREFENSPKDDALRDRVELANACLTIITACINANFVGPAPLGSFERWSRMVRDPLLWLGMPDPVAVAERTFDNDPERESAIAFLSAWREVFGVSGATAAEAVRSSHSNRALADALEEIVGRAGRVSTRSLGRWLARHAARVLSGLKVEKCGGNSKNGIRWRVVDHKPGGGV